VTTYSVVVSETAKQNLRDAYRWAAQQAPETAARWLERFEAELGTLAAHPARCGAAPESNAVGKEIRQFLFGRRPHVWRALFVIEGSEVRILHIRRATMDTASPNDLGISP
jgi:plasmid stabilization system protein ParE